MNNILETRSSNYYRVDPSLFQNWLRRQLAMTPSFSNVPLAMPSMTSHLTSSVTVQKGIRKRQSFFASSLIPFPRNNTISEK
jgi:hypothetical protein